MKHIKKQKSKDSAEDLFQASESQFREFYEHAEISIWNEDMSEVHKALEEFRIEGVEDLGQYLKDNPRTAWDLAVSIRLIQVNEATLKLFGANSEEEFLSQIDGLNRHLR